MKIYQSKQIREPKIVESVKKQKLDLNAVTNWNLNFFPQYQCLEECKSHFSSRPKDEKF